MGAVAFILKGYPRLSETFIAQEILALEQRGLDIRIHALRHPTDPHRHPVHDEIAAPVAYLPEYLHHEPGRVLRAWKRVRTLPGYNSALRAWIFDLKRDFSRNRVRRFGQACVLIDELPHDVTHLHAHFLHTPASVARYASLISGLPWSGSAHAKDIYTSAHWDIREKLAECQWAVTCTRANATYLNALLPESHKRAVTCIYHGLDLNRFANPQPRHSERDGSNPYEPVKILSVGRAVEKKGYDGLLQALAALPHDLHWRFVHIGGGPQLATLRDRAQHLGIAAKIKWHGALPQEQVLAAYRSADIFVLNSRIAEDGDRDGLPNVLMEAQSQGLACIATDISAISELIEDGTTGLLVPPDVPQALCDSLQTLLCSPAKRREFGDAGEQRVRATFSLDGNITELAKLFGL